VIKPAAYSEKIGEDKVKCNLCPVECLLKINQKGICQCRFNRGGELVTDNYGELVTLAIDPIEKKPLYHFYPASEILSTGPNGCNLKCINCQNWTISQKKVETRFLSPEALLKEAKRSNTIGVAFTYTEPVIWYEYIMDTAPLLKNEGLKTVLVSNGYINPQPLDDLLEYVDAVNVDLKGICQEFYKKICKGKLDPILETIRRIAGSKTHLEITNLIIPTLNDSEEDMINLFDFVASVSEMIPLHLSAYHPGYKLDIPHTPLETLLRARELAREKLKYVFIGNVAIEGAGDTYCANCDNKLIERNGYFTKILGMNNTKCAKCGSESGIIR